MTRTIVRSSTLPRSTAQVWARVTTEAGIRDELRPFLRMAMPPGLRGQSITSLGDRLEQPLGKAWLFLGGILPIEYDDMTVVALEPGRSFHERSSMLWLSRWEHRRSVLPSAGQGREQQGGCEVRDELTFTGRHPWLEPIAERVVTALFAHRHRRLQRWAR